MPRSKGKNDPSERIRSAVLTIGGVLTLAGGVALSLVSPFALPLFVANTVLRRGYLLWAERVLVPEMKRIEKGDSERKTRL